MATIKTTSNVASKSIGTKQVQKTSESFSIDASKIPTSSESITAKNVQDALEEIATQIAVQTTAPTSAVTEGDMWYDTDDDKLYVRDEDSWNELVSSVSGTVDGGSY
jgi:hypothetical protein